MTDVTEPMRAAGAAVLDAHARSGSRITKADLAERMYKAMEEARLGVRVLTNAMPGTVTVSAP